jgi:hypothetical protein
VKKNLGMDLPPTWGGTDLSMDVEKSSLIDGTGKMETDESSLTSQNYEEMNIAMKDYSRSMEDLTSSLAEFRSFIHKMKEREEKRVTG